MAYKAANQNARFHSAKNDNIRQYVKQWTKQRVSCNLIRLQCTGSRNSLQVVIHGDPTPHNMIIKYWSSSQNHFGDHSNKQLRRTKFDESMIGLIYVLATTISEWPMTSNQLCRAHPIIAELLATAPGRAYTLRRITRMSDNRRSLLSEIRIESRDHLRSYNLTTQFRHGTDPINNSIMRPMKHQEYHLATRSSYPFSHYDVPCTLYRAWCNQL